MSDIELLRRAAAQMREKAEATTKTKPRWWVDGPALLSGKYWVYDVGEKFESRNDAEHIAGMDPTVALAVANLLKDVAGWIESALTLYTIKGNALKVAKAYLREE